MNVRVRIKTKYHRDVVLKNLEYTLPMEVGKGLQTLGKRLVTASASRMRQDTGAAKKSLQVQISDTTKGLELLVYSTLIRAYVDAYGLPKGVLPPYGLGTPLYRWAVRRVRGHPVKQIATAGRVTRRSLRINRTLTKGQQSRLKRAKIANITNIRNARAKEKPQDRLWKSERAERRKALRLAYVVARGIFNKGIKASRWNRETLNANRNRIILDIRNSVLRAINKAKRG